MFYFHIFVAIVDTYQNERMEKMSKKTSETIVVKNYKKTGIVAAIVIVVAVLGIWAVRSFNSDSGSSVEDAIALVSEEAVSGGDMRIAVVRMDEIQNTATALKNLREQKEKYEESLRDELTRDQKALEKEKAEIEKSQDVLSREALQRRIVDYQNKVTKLQRDLTERAQAIEISYQKALNEVQKKHLDPVVEGVIAKKKLSLVIDGRMARTGANIANLDITDELIKALDRKVSKVKMETPKGF
ncbi:MAG: OmpH family outer membrane protein [Alphaproteobacteria bacterium]|nr:OmpH family outer membrane protein [Alphaproteobacteria bacterium]